MKIQKKKVLRLLFLVEVLCFFSFYIFGKNGVLRIKSAKKDNMEFEEKINNIKLEIESVKKDIIIWKSSDFYKEKYARERLQMAREGDRIYIIK